MRRLVGIPGKVKVVTHSPVNHAFRVQVKINKAEAEAWMRKYFVAASIARGWGFLIIRGIIARALISRPNQASNKWWLVMVITDPVARLKEKISSAWGVIRKGRS